MKKVSQTRFKFSKLQLECVDKSIAVANSLVGMQTSKGNFNFGKNLKTKNHAKHNLYDHFLSAGVLCSMQKTYNYNYNPYSKHNTSIYIPPTDKALKWGLRKYLKPHKLGQSKGLEDPKLIAKNDTVLVEVSAQALISSCYFINYMMACKYSMMVTWRLDNHEHYVSKANSLAEGLFSYIKKDGTFLGEPEYLPIILQALFEWVATCQKLWAWYPKFESREFFTYKQRGILHKILNNCCKDKSYRSNEDFIKPLTLALFNTYDSEKYRETYLMWFNKLLDKATKSQSLLAALEYYGTFSDKNYEKNIAMLTNKLAKHIGDMSYIKKDGKVVEKKKFSIKTLTGKLRLLHDFAIYKPYSL